MMLTDAEIEALFREQETDRVERKESIKASDKTKEAICAFSNDLPDHRLPGVIFVGQKDDGSCAAIEIDEVLLETLGGWRSDGNILPFPVMSVRRMLIDGCAVAVVIVQPSPNPPVRYNGRTWIRVGPRRATATVAEENILTEKRQWKNLPFDAQGLTEARIEDLDLKRFELEYLPAAFSKEILDENGRTMEQKLRALRLIDDGAHPTAAAVLLLGLEPRRWFPGAYIQFISIDGMLLTDPIKDQREITGTLGDQLRQLDELIDLSIPVATIVGGNTRVEEVAYPVTALKQIARNALLHRTYQDTHAPVRVTWYQDRVEFMSPGGTFGRVTPETLGDLGVTDYRNPTVAEALKSQGFVDRFGIGFQIVKEAMKANGNPPIEIDANQNFVNIILRSAK